MPPDRPRTSRWRERRISKKRSSHPPLLLPRRRKSTQRTAVDIDYSDTEMSASNDATLVGKKRIATKQRMKFQFSTMVGKAETLEQVAAASQWMTFMLCTPRDPLKFEIFNAHMEKIGLPKVWAEIIQYRMIGQISTYFLPGQSLRNGGQDDINALDELEISVCGWVRLASEGRLSRLEEFAEVEDGEGRYNSVAERFRAFMDAYKRRGNYEEWTYNRMKVLRYDIYKVVHELDAEDERPMLPSSEYIILFSAETSPFADFALARSTGDQPLRSRETGHGFDEGRSRDSEESSLSNNRGQRDTDERTIEDIYNATPAPRNRSLSTNYPRAESSCAASSKTVPHMAEPEDQFS
jgi:hypothetical protein